MNKRPDKQLTLKLTGDLGRLFSQVSIPADPNNTIAILDFRSGERCMFNLLGGKVIAPPKNIEIPDKKIMTPFATRLMLMAIGIAHDNIIGNKIDKKAYDGYTAKISGRIETPKKNHKAGNYVIPIIWDL